MAQDKPSGTPPAVAFVVGMLVVVVGLLAYFMVAGTDLGNDFTISIEGQDSTVEKAAEAISDG